MQPMLAPREVVIAGGGVAGLECALALRDLSDGAASVTLLAPDERVELEALAPARAFDAAEPISIALDELAGRHGITLRADRLALVDADRRRARCVSGAEQPYDTLVVAIGAARRPAFEGVVTYHGAESDGMLRTLRAEIAAAAIGSLCVVVPPGASWTLPAYEIAFLAAREARSAGVAVEIVVVTPEERPLAVLGPAAADAVTALLAEAGVSLRTAAYAVAGDGLVLHPGGERLACDRLLAMPRAVGVAVPGLPADADGFIPVDDFGRVGGVDDVYAVGDCTANPIKQGGLAAIQADVVALHVAAAMGAAVTPTPFRPVLRGKLITGDAEWFLRFAVAGGDGAGDADDRPLWMPSAKVWGRYLPRSLESSIGGDG